MKVSKVQKDSKNTKAKKEAVLLMLEKLPVVSAVCEKVGICRKTFYRWKEKDKTFAKAVEEAQVFSIGKVNDLAEGKLISLIKQGNLGAIIFWLKTHHPTYRQKVELQAQITGSDLSKEQQKVVLKALKLTQAKPIAITPAKDEA